jgi:hypothetical protein
MSEFKTPEKKRVRINEEGNMERLDSGKLTKKTRKEDLTIQRDEQQKSLFHDKYEKHYGVEPGGLMTGDKLSYMYENYKDPQSEDFQKLWGTVEFNPDDEFSIKLINPPTEKGGKKSRKTRKSKKSRKNRKSRRKH